MIRYEKTNITNFLLSGFFVRGYLIARKIIEVIILQITPISTHSPLKFECMQYGRWQVNTIQTVTVHIRLSEKVPAHLRSTKPTHIIHDHSKPFLDRDQRMYPDEICSNPSQGETDYTYAVGFRAMFPFKNCPPQFISALCISYTISTIAALGSSNSLLWPSCNFCPLLYIMEDWEEEGYKFGPKGFRLAVIYPYYTMLW